jgi:hypothetical protein
MTTAIVKWMPPAPAVFAFVNAPPRVSRSGADAPARKRPMPRAIRDEGPQKENVNGTKESDQVSENV